MKKTILILLMVVAALLYTLKVFNSDLVEKGYSKWYLLRHSLVGAVGSANFVWWTYELLRYYHLPDGLCLATAGGIGFLGADLFARTVEKFLDRIISKF